MNTHTIIIIISSIQNVHSCIVLGSVRLFSTVDDSVKIHLPNPWVDRILRSNLCNFKLVYKLFCTINN